MSTYSRLSRAARAALSSIHRSAIAASEAAFCRLLDPADPGALYRVDALEPRYQVTPTITFDVLANLYLGYSVHFFATAEDQVNGWVIDWGDGGPCSTLESASGSLTHQYANPLGCYGLTMWDIDENYLGGGTVSGTENFTSLTTSNWSQGVIPSGQDKVVDVNFSNLDIEGTLDINDNTLLIHANPNNRLQALSSIENLVSSAYNNGAWNGPGITSSYVAGFGSSSPRAAIGIFLNDSLLNVYTPLYQSYAGHPVDQNTIIVRPTLLGDMNGDGLTDGFESAILGTNYYKPASTHYCQGDLDYTHSVGPYMDVSIFSSAFGRSLPQIIPPKLSIGGAGQAIQGFAYTLNLTPARSDITLPVPDHTTIDWGDGSDPDTITGAPTAAQHRFFASPGAYDIQAKAYDSSDNELYHSNLNEVFISSAPSVFSSTNPIVDEGTTSDSVSFSNSDGYPADTSGKFLYSFAFNGNATSPSTSPTASIPPTYLADGPATLVVTGTVTDTTTNQTASYESDIEINNVAPTLTISGSHYLDDAHGYVLGLAALTQQQDPIMNWFINWGDGTTSTVSGSTITTPHTYPSKASDKCWIINAAASDKDGSYDSNTLTVNNFLSGMPDLLPLGTGTSLGWNLLNATATRFDIYQQVNNGSRTLLAQLDGTATSYTPSRAAKTIYHYDIEAVSGGTVIASTYEMFWDYPDYPGAAFAQIRPHRTGMNFGAIVGESVKDSNDPSNFVILTDDQASTAQPFWSGTQRIAFDHVLNSVSTSQANQNLSKINLISIQDYRQTAGTYGIEVSDPSAIRIFKSDGTPLPQSEWTYIVGQSTNAYLTPGYYSNTIWLEGLHADSDLTFSLVWRDGQGNVISSDSVHMTIADWQITDYNGNTIASVSAFDKDDLVANANADPDVPQIGNAIYFKNHIEGLSSSQIQSLTLASANNPGDSITDTLNGSSTSTNWHALYSSDSAMDVLSTADQGLLLSTFALQAVHNAAGKEVLTTPEGDKLTRDVKKQTTYDSNDLYNWLSTDPGYGEKSKFVLDEMKARGFKFEVESLHLRNFDGTKNGAWVDIGALNADGSVDIPTAKEWALDALREWAGNGATTYTQRKYFIETTRKWASPPHMTDAALSVGSTLDFLYFFSEKGSSHPSSDMFYFKAGAQRTVPVYDLFEIVSEVYSGKRNPALPIGTAAMVNLPNPSNPQLTNFHSDYWEADKTGCNTSPGKDALGRWPLEDQTHHFAAYFYLGAKISDSDAALNVALWRTNDSQLNVSGSGPQMNPGDYYLGVLAADLGNWYSDNPGYHGDFFTAQLRQGWQASFAAMGRTTLP